MVERQVRRLDRVQQRHPALAFPWAVVQKFGNDQAGAHATQVAYHGLFSLFPLLLLLTTLLGFLLEDDPGLQQRLLTSALADFPILGTQLQATARPLRGNGLALLIGIGGTIYGALGVGQAAQEAMNSVWNVPYVAWPNFFVRRVRAMAAVLLAGMAVVGSAVQAIGNAPTARTEIATTSARQATSLARRRASTPNAYPVRWPATRHDVAPHGPCPRAEPLARS